MNELVGGGSIRCSVLTIGSWGKFNLFICMTDQLIRWEDLDKKETCVKTGGGHRSMDERVLPVVVGVVDGHTRQSSLGSAICL